MFVTGVIVARLIAEALGVSGGGLRDLAPGATPDYLALAWSSAAQLLLRYGAILGIAFAIGRRPLRDYGITTAGLSARQIVTIGVVLFSAGGLLPRLIFFAKDHVPLGRAPAHWSLISDTSSIEFWIYMAVSSFGLVPIVEELFFRGYVQTRLQDAFGAPAAIVMTTLLFTLSHRQYFIASGVGIGMMVSLLVGSLFAGYTRHRFGTLLPGILAHAIGNVPIRGWSQALLLVLMIVVLILSFPSLLEHARSLRSLLTSRTILPAAAIAVATVAAVLAIALFARPALPVVGLAALVTALLLRRGNASPPATVRGA